MDTPIEVPEVTVEVLGNTTEKVGFTPAQQAVFDASLKRAMGRAGADARAEAAALKLENERLKAQAIGAAPDSSEVEKLRAQVADSQLMAAAAEARATAQSKAILQAKLGAQIDAVSPDDVSKLLKDNLHYNAATKSFDVLDDNGAVRDGVTPEALYAEFAASHLWSIKGRVISGAGSTSSSGSALRPPTYELTALFGPGSSAQLANKVSIQQPALYKQLRADAKAKGLVV